jgi:hypothetical protein
MPWASDYPGMSDLFWNLTADAVVILAQWAIAALRNRPHDEVGRPLGDEADEDQS